MRLTIAMPWTLCVVFILILVSFSPSISSVTLSTTCNENDETIEETQFDGWPLSISLNKLEYNCCKKIKGEYFAIYYTEYEIENTGSAWYFGRPDSWVRESDSSIWLDYWNEGLLILSPGKSKSFSHYIKIKTSSNADIDQERIFADHPIVLETGVEDQCGHPDDPLSNVRIAKYWNENSFYEPTYAHLLVSTPWRYSLNDEETVLELQDIEQFSDVIKNERLGWIAELTSNLKNILDATSELSEIERENVFNWIIEICNYFNTLIEEGGNQSKLIQILNNYPQIEIEPITNYVNWKNTEPWINQIRILLEVKGVRKGETLEVICRGQSSTFKDLDDGVKDRICNIELYVSSEPTDAEKNNIGLHDCTIKIKGNRHLKSIKTVPLLSYCYSNGTVAKSFGRLDWLLSSCFDFF